MQTIDQPITATGAAADLAAGADAYFVVGMLATLTVRLVDSSGTPAPPSGLGNVAAWRFVLAEDWDAATVPCYRTESVAYDPGTATWTVPLTATRTEQALKALGKKGEIAIGCELVGLPENGTWDKPAFVLQWNAKLRGRRDSDGSPTPVDPAPVTAHAATHASTGSDPVTPSSIGAAASTHSHEQSDVIGLANALAGKAPAQHSHAQSDVTGLADALAGKAAAQHSHAQSDVTGLADALAGKAAAQHSHAQSDVSGLANALAAKASAADVTAIQNVIPADASATNKLVTQSNVPQPQLRYALVEPSLAESGTTVSATLQDRAVNAVTLASTVTAATFTFPAPVAGYARDFFVRLVIEGSTVPTISFLESGGGSLEDAFDADDDAWAEIEPGVNVLMFTETSQEGSAS